MNIDSIQDQSKIIKINAIDHRGSIKKYIPEEHIIDFKNLATEIFAPHVTAVLLDPQFGKEAREIALQKGIGILWSSEKSGYATNKSEEGRITEILESFNPKKSKQEGVDVMKLLLYYNPGSETAQKQIETLKNVYNKCQEADIPLLVEPITYEIDGEDYHRAQLTLQTIRDIYNYTDIFKLEFPEIISEDNYMSEIEHSRETLHEIDALIENKPWILLSRGLKFHIFEKALAECMQAGANGYAVGRAIWQEIVDYKTWQEQQEFMRTTCIERFKRLNEIMK